MASPAKARWIWRSEGEAAPRNRFTWFRRVVHLDALPEDATLHFAADSTAQLFINGRVLRRKVARYSERSITAEVVNAGPHLRPGANVVAVLHHNWGPIITFQRDANEHAGLFVCADWIASDASWRWIQAPGFALHDKQILGIAGNAPRIRYPILADAASLLGGEVHDPAFDDSGWAAAAVVESGPWPEEPAPVETPGQRESDFAPLGVVAAGRLAGHPPLESDPLAIDPWAISATHRRADPRPDEALGAAARAHLRGADLVFDGCPGESFFATFDFQRPLHGYPFLEVGECPAGVAIDIGYGEIVQRIHDGSIHARPDGWIDTEGVVGSGYADRVVLGGPARRIELPDERTARWVALHVRFPEGGAEASRVVLRRFGFAKSQYPIAPVGSFAAGDPRIDRIVRLGIDHAEVTMTDAYVDTPGREDGQWIEDNRPRANIAQHWFGDTALRRFLLRTFATGQGADGDFHPFAPSNYPAYPAPRDWSVQWAAALWDEYMWSGDPAVIRQHWRSLAAYWDFVLREVREDGLWVLGAAVLADIRMPPEPRRGQSSGQITPWMIERLEWSSAMASAIGEADAAAHWAERAAAMRDAFRRFHIVPASGGRPALVANVHDPSGASIDRGFSQAGQTIAAWTGLLTREEARAALDYCFPAPHGAPPAGVSRWNNPTNGYRVLRALTEVGLADRAVAHLFERYGPYLPLDPSNPTPIPLQGPAGGPLPEYWVSREDMGAAPGAIVHAQPADETGSHGWGAVPLLWMHDSLLGVRLAEPGGAKLRIAPQHGGLPYIGGHVGTPKGTVFVHYEPQQGRLDVRLPAGVEAEVVLPPEMDPGRTHVAEVAVEAAPSGRGAWRVAGPGRTVLEAF